MNFRTQVHIPPFSPLMDYHCKIVSVGSCFAENMAQRLKQNKFTVLVNPFGILYNPVSICNCLERLISAQNFDFSDLHHDKQRWVSFLHHGNFSNPDKSACLENINRELQRAHEFLKQADWLILTFGTAFVYEHKKSGLIVANCHRFPSSEFTRYPLPLTSSIKKCQDLIDLLQKFNPKLHILLTISPIRHWKDGATQNQLSKSTLVLLAHELKKTFKRVHYFPSYEIMMDDLRDYRFYQEDMLHPNETAIAYIWQKFTQSHMSKETLSIMSKVQKICQAKNHRPRYPGSIEHQNFCNKQLDKIAQLQKEYPYLDFTQELTYFKEQLTLK